MSPDPDHVPQKPCIILLNGFPGVGKLTIARSLLESLKNIEGVTGILVDNHQVIDLVTRVLKIEKHSPAYYAARKSVVRSEFFDHIKPEVGTVVIMTSVFAEESEEGVDQWRDHIALAKEKGMGIFQINIRCSSAINEERLVTEERLTSTKGKNTHIPRLRELRQTQTMLRPRSTPQHRKDIDDAGIEVRYLDVDNSTESAEESAGRIMRLFFFTGWALWSM